jgi:hypothetical protein
MISMLTSSDQSDGFGTLWLSIEGSGLKLPKEGVYKWFDRDGKEFLCHTTAKRAPPVATDDSCATEAARERISAKAKRRRGGSVNAPERKEGEQEARNWGRNSVPRYIECRGLRFDPETRMFYDRDGASARAIAGLRCLKRLQEMLVTGTKVI